MMYLICLVLVVSLVGLVQATTVWTDATGDHLWSTADNWNNGLPNADQWTRIKNGLPGPTIDFEGAVAHRVHIGYTEGALTVDGGTFLIAEWDLILGKNGGEGILNMISGSIDVARDFAFEGPGVVNMTGGTITVAGDFKIPVTEGSPDSPAVVNLNGGTISIGGDLHMFEHGLLDITAGTLILDGNDVAVVQGYIDNGWITPYDVNGTVLLDYDAIKDQTTVKALHKFNPIPADANIVTPGNIMLEWTVDAGTQVDVWFSTKSNPIEWTEDDRTVKKQAATSTSVTVSAKQKYYWAVDTYAAGAEKPEYGHVFSFLADNAPPVVNAGADVITWLTDGSVEVILSGTVDDSDPTTTLWAVDSEPDDPNSPKAVIADPTALDSTITLSALGDYILKLTADDSEYQSNDTMTISVYADSCLAAQSLPEYEALEGDLDNDCDVDQDDLDRLMANWLKCVALGICDINVSDE